RLQLPQLLLRVLEEQAQISDQGLEAIVTRHPPGAILQRQARTRAAPHLDVPELEDVVDVHEHVEEGSADQRLAGHLPDGADAYGAAIGLVSIEAHGQERDGV